MTRFLICVLLSIVVALTSALVPFRLDGKYRFSAFESMLVGQDMGKSVGFSREARSSELTALNEAPLSGRFEMGGPIPIYYVVDGELGQVSSLAIPIYCNGVPVCFCYESESYFSQFGNIGGGPSFARSLTPGMAFGLREGYPMAIVNNVGSAEEASESVTATIFDTPEGLKVAYSVDDGSGRQTTPADDNLVTLQDFAFKGRPLFSDNSIRVVI